MATNHNTHVAHIFFAHQDGHRALEIQRFRKQLFFDILGWQLNISDDREVDEFDTPDAIYAGLYRLDGAQSELVGTFRSIATTQNYLAESVFPQLAVTSAYPKSPHCYEISRFGVLPSRTFGTHSQILYALMFQFAVLHQVRSLVAVTDLYHERFLASRKIRTRRFGLPIEIPRNTGNAMIKIVAGEIPIAAQDSIHLQALLSTLNGVLIHDTTLVLRHQSISA